MIPSKYLWPLLIIGGTIAAYVFYDRILEIIIGVFGLGALAEGAKQKAKKARTVADEHEDLAQYDLQQSNESAQKAEKSHDQAIEDSEDITPVDEKDGFKRTTIRSR